VTDHEREFVDKLLDAGLARYSAIEPPPGLEGRLLAVLRAAARSEEPVDQLLDAGLASYSAAEPRPGIEQRILAGLRAQPQPSRWLDWRWAGALATAAAALVLVIFFMPQPEAPAPHPNAQTPQRALSGPEGRLGAGPPPVAKAAVRRPSQPFHPTRVESPRLETFPAPAPLSEQERLLLLFARQAPREAALVAQGRSRPTEPLGIAPLPQIEELVKKPEVTNN
jgi:hypothetical protein